MIILLCSHLCIPLIVIPFLLDPLLSTYASIPSSSSSRPKLIIHYVPYASSRQCLLHSSHDLMPPFRCFGHSYTYFSAILYPAIFFVLFDSKHTFSLCCFFLHDYYIFSRGIFPAYTCCFTAVIACKRKVFVERNCSV